MFFFSSRRRHTRYIGDWSSDVCSSDLPLVVEPVTPAPQPMAPPKDAEHRDAADESRDIFKRSQRSEERRVGKECRSTGSAEAYKEKEKIESRTREGKWTSRDIDGAELG